MVKRKESRAELRARLKAQRKKFGLGEFSKKSNPNNNNKTRTRSVRSNPPKMARKRRSSSNPTFLGALMKPLVAGLVFAFVQPFISVFLRRFNIGIQDELFTIIAALVIRTFFKGQLVRLWADTAIAINVASLIRPLAGRLLGENTLTV